MGFLALGALGCGLAFSVFERIALIGLAAGGLVRIGQTMRARHRRKPRGSVALEETALVRREPGNEHAVLTNLRVPFGITVLANQMRSEVLLAFTTAEQTRYQRVRVASPADALAARHLLARAITVPDADAIGAQDVDSAMTATHAAELIRVAECFAPNALQRIYLTGSRGEVLTLDGTELEIGGRVFDLSLPLEWRGFMFHEAVGPVATLYQATWIRQGGTEAVLVAPMPAEIATTLPPGAAADMKAAEQRAVLRDLKLMQSTPDSAPPQELRIGVERLFMLPLRQALDRAPRASRGGFPPVRTLNPRAPE
ncbi:MAG TPA: hypothetical protein VNO21_11815 [Polyangiaceae bacterium]|nr:hypothetical protein [Polyangiaceae bacterium]